MGRGAPGKASSRISCPLAARQRLVLRLWVPSPRPVLDWGEGVCSWGGRMLLLLSAFLVGKYIFIYSIVLPGKAAVGVRVCACAHTRKHLCVCQSMPGRSDRRRVAASVSSLLEIPLTVTASVLPSAAPASLCSPAGEPVTAISLPLTSWQFLFFSPSVFRVPVMFPPGMHHFYSQYSIGAESGRCLPMSSSQ